MKILVPFIILCAALLLVVVRGLLAGMPQTAARAPLTKQIPPRSDSDIRSASGGSDASRAPESASPVPAAAPYAARRLPRSSIAPSETPGGVGRGSGARPSTHPATLPAPHEHARRDERRLAELRGILASDPYNERAIREALELARTLERYDETCHLLVRLLRLRPDDIPLRLELATELMRARRWFEALPHLRYVANRQPDNARAWYDLAIAHQALAHLRDARATWDRAIELMSENPDAHFHRGEVLLDLHHWREAAADFETVRRLEPESVDATLNLSLALSKLGRFDEARTPLLSILEERPRHVPVLNRLAEITWAAYERDPVAGTELAGETLDYCARSLAIDANQPAVKLLLERAAKMSE